MDAERSCSKKSCPVAFVVGLLLLLAVVFGVLLPFGWSQWNVLRDNRYIRQLVSLHEVAGDRAFQQADYQAALTAYVRARAVLAAPEIEKKVARARSELIAIRPDLIEARLIPDLDYECRWLLGDDPTAQATCKVVSGHIAAFNQNVEAAKKAYKEALEQRPDCAGAHLGLALIAYRTGDTKTAQSEFEAVIKKHPQHLDSLIGLGDVHLAAGDTEAAIKAYTMAIEAQDDSRARHGLGLAYARQNRIQAAVAEFEKSIALNPQSFASYVALGNLLAGSGALARAEQAFRSALALRQDSSVQVALASVLTRQGRAAEALQIITPVLNSGVREPSVLLEAARALEALGRIDEARGFYEATSNALRESTLDKETAEAFRREVAAGLERTAPGSARQEGRPR